MATDCALCTELRQDAERLAAAGAGLEQFIDTLISSYEQDEHRNVLDYLWPEIVAADQVLRAALAAHDARTGSHRGQSGPSASE